MAVFKRKRGGKADSGWTIQIVDHAGVKRRLPGFKTKSASEELDRAISRLVSIRQVNGSFSTEDNRFIESAPARIRDRLAKWNIIQGERAAAGKLLMVHVEDWRCSRVANGISKKQIANTVARTSKIIADCGWNAISDISASDIEKWREREKNSGVATMTLNHYLAAVKTFCNWLVEKKRLVENPIVHMEKMNAATDRRRERRSFTIEEIGRILAAAESGPETHGMAGPVRALLYRTAIESGLRWSELRSLTRASFDFDVETATVTIAAEDAKNQKEDTLPLRPELAGDLKAHMALFLPGAKAFPGMGNKGAEMLRVDLEAAGVPYVDEYGLVGDFHAFRHSFGSLGAKAGIPLAVMQKLMRHSDPKLTANLYTHILVKDKADELAKLPTIAPIHEKEERAKKTGTDASVVANADQNRDTHRDTRRTTFNGQRRTYTNAEQGRKRVEEDTTRNEKSPCATGGNEWRRERDSNPREVALQWFSRPPP